MSDVVAPVHGIARLAVTPRRAPHNSIITQGFYTAAATEQDRAAAFSRCTRFQLHRAAPDAFGKPTAPVDTWLIGEMLPQPALHALAVARADGAALHIWTYADTPGGVFSAWFFPHVVLESATPGEHSTADLSGWAVRASVYPAGEPFTLDYADQLPENERPVWGAGEQAVVMRGTTLPAITQSSHMMHS